MDLKIKTLQNTSIIEIVDALAESFKNYFVPIVADYEMWELRLTTARLHKNLSVGVFDGDKLIAFILNCIDDDHDGRKTAYNTGTGVIEEYRNQQLVDKMYDFIIPILKENGVEKLKLEVITENHRAIKVYERVGFTIVKDRKLLSYAGNLKNVSEEGVTLKEISKEDFKKIEKEDIYYSWDFREVTLTLNENLKIYEVNKNEEYQGYFILNFVNNSVVQIEANNNQWNLVFGGIKQLSNEIRLINIDSKRKSLIEYLENIGFENKISQYEMEKLID